ncbi:hypothetical protein [Pelosinus sp. sgz500959]|uniref:hypothetical protein n=1 Tax=Pelosinus sp. sgz500959 TaxID=3242472 RepID=UPI00366FB356
MENADIIKKIRPLFASSENFQEIEYDLSIHSNLPGPRANLTLAFKFADCFKYKGMSNDLLGLLIGWVNLSEEEAPTNNPREYLSFCGILALGAYYCYADEETQNIIMNKFKIAMNDSRWRMREGVAMGFQIIAEKDFNSIKKYFSIWYSASTYTEKRTFMAALAHPPILKNKEIAQFSLTLSECILSDVLSSSKESRKTEGFAVLSKGLQYALSVFVAALPEEGFALLKRYAQSNDPDLKKILKSNLSKSRLTKKYTQLIDEVLEIMN